MRRTIMAVSLASLVVMTVSQAHAAAGPDVIIGFVDDGREDSRVGSKVGLTASTNACSIGTEPVSWRRLSDHRHPAITVNLYRLADGRMEQLAASWVKHGFFATNQEACAGLSEVPMPCLPGSGGDELRPGCSDYYSEDLNSDPNLLGPRSKINPTTGVFDGAKAQDLTGYPTSTPTERILIVEESILGTANARYFVEAHYIASDDATALNSRNNVTYREVTPILRAGRWVLKNASDETRLQPAISAWAAAGAKLSETTVDEGPVKAHVIVGSKATQLADGKYRYDYLVYNMNSEAAIGRFEVPARSVEGPSVEFRAGGPSGEIWSTAPWTPLVRPGSVSWSTAAASANPKANAIRWGSAYGFSFVSTAAPVDREATVSRFGAAASPSFKAAVIAPGG